MNELNNNLLMCCCCPDKCLKGFIFVACVLIIGAGAALIWLGYVYVNSFITDLHKYSFIGYIITACGATMIFVSLFGFIGS
jgi:hypothetical protein